MSSISVSVPVVVSATVPRATGRSAVNVPIGYLRAFITGLVAPIDEVLARVGLA